jgi:hypothetical protein
VVHFIACVGLADPAEFVLANGTGHVIAALDALDLSLADWAKYDSFDFKFLAYIFFASQLSVSELFAVIAHL